MGTGRKVILREDVEKARKAMMAFFRFQLIDRSRFENSLTSLEIGFFRNHFGIEEERIVDVDLQGIIQLCRTSS